MIFTDEAIILTRAPLKENDKTVSLYTKAHGRRRAAARGTMKLLSKLSGHLEPFCVVQVTLACGGADDKILQATSFWRPRLVLGDATAFYLLAAAAELVHKATPLALPQTQIFDALLRYERAIEVEAGDASAGEAHFISFFRRFLELIGFGGARTETFAEALQAARDHLEFEPKSLVALKKTPECRAALLATY